MFPGRDELDALCQRHYNATVTSIREHEPGLWVMHIAPDGPIPPLEPGQYTTPLTTREPENDGNKVYIQDLLDSGGVEKALGVSIDVSNTHFYLCGNPQMIGLPEWRDDGTLEFPATRGVCEILTERGFTLDHRRERGNVHYEDYGRNQEKLQ